MSKRTNRIGAYKRAYVYVQRTLTSRGPKVPEIAEVFAAWVGDDETRLQVLDLAIEMTPGRHQNIENFTKLLNELEEFASPQKPQKQTPATSGAPPATRSKATRKRD